MCRLSSAYLILQFFPGAGISISPGALCDFVTWVALSAYGWRGLVVLLYKPDMRREPLSI